MPHPNRKTSRRPPLLSLAMMVLAAAPAFASQPGTSDAATRALAEASRAPRERGLHVQQGRTPPLHELLLWACQQPRVYEVALPEGFTQPVRVFILEDFLSNGWTHYSRCGMRGPGGWANQEGLYAVKHRYDSLDSEEFRVSFLGHEAQHFADLRRWPDMPSWHLEYRAKLAQLVLASKSLDKIIEQFVRTRTDDKSLPHPHANGRVVEHLLARLDTARAGTLTSVPRVDIKRTARVLLLEDTRALSTP